MMFFGSPQYLTTFLNNSCDASYAVQSVGTCINIAYFENRSTTTRMEPNPSDFGKAYMKSRDALSKGRSGEVSMDLGEHKDSEHIFLDDDDDEFDDEFGDELDDGFDSFPADSKGKTSSD
ncbi:hypothetical protein PIB30_009240 [Stylosanthes scabra]|uniref:Uncharacterized protein n=1 Tax=Stylosanthes scabra TaxID=79078 RepID=A0ABU6Q5Y3_9FABA|nr:hypothetical protein [Stylosanthes scabra]